ncbi:hypothetical protein M8C21_027475, partial [Ambrosia artemisiifolia]
VLKTKSRSMPLAIQETDLMVDLIEFLVLAHVAILRLACLHDTREKKSSGHERMLSAQINILLDELWSEGEIRDQALMVNTVEDGFNLSSKLGKPEDNSIPSPTQEVHYIHSMYLLFRSIIIAIIRNRFVMLMFFPLV